MNIATTLIAREKYASALTGEAVIAEATQIAFGDGGHDTEGEPIDIDIGWTTIPGELLQKNLDTISRESFTVEMLGVLEQGELNGEDISSAGIYDADNDLLAVATFNPIPKTSDDRFELDWSTIF